MLTKEMIIGGIKNTKIIELPMYDNEEVAIREISDLEYNQFTSAYRDVGNFDHQSKTNQPCRRHNQIQNQSRSNGKKEI